MTRRGNLFGEDVRDVMRSTVGVRCCDFGWNGRFDVCCCGGCWNGCWGKRRISSSRSSFVPVRKAAVL